MKHFFHRKNLSIVSRSLKKQTPVLVEQHIKNRYDYLDQMNDDMGLDYSPSPCLFFIIRTAPGLFSTKRFKFNAFYAILGQMILPPGFKLQADLFTLLTTSPILSTPAVPIQTGAEDFPGEVK
jgi:hypothetical protein